MHRLLFPLLLFLATPSVAQEFVSLTPSSVEAGAAVTVTGGPFGPQVRVIVGDHEVEPSRWGSRQLTFTAPALPEGDYSVYLREGSRTSSRALPLRIVSPPPLILSLAPANIDECAGESQRQVTVTGRHFQPGALVLLDGKAIASSRSDENSLSFTAPPLSSGIYGVQVANPDNKKSLPHSLWFNNIPEIFSVRQAEDYVSYYELVIEGKNFALNSALLVSEYPVGPGDLPPQQRILTIQRRIGDPLGVQGENIYFVDCHTLIYNRFPYSSQPKDIILQVVNPDGRKTTPLRISVP